MIITKAVIDKAREQFITLDELAYLYSRACALDWNVDINATSLHKLSALDLLVNGELTENGALLLNSVFPDIDMVEDYTPDFEEFWKAYPQTTEDGRFLRKSKKDAFLAYRTAIKKGFRPGDILKALRKELAMKVISAEGLKYMKNIVNYLNTEHFTTLMEDDVETQRYGKKIF